MLTRKEAMELLKVSRATLIRMERRGVLHPIKISERKVLYSEEEIEKILKEGSKSMSKVQSKKSF